MGPQKENPPRMDSTGLDSETGRIPPYIPPDPDQAAALADLAKRSHLLMQTHRNVMRRFFQNVGMFNGHPHMLFCIRETPGMTQRQLADVMGIAPASAAVSLKRMAAAGLVEKRPDPEDGRSLRLYLTKAGKRMDTACREGRDFLTAAQFADFSSEEIRQLAALLDKMTRNLERVVAFPAQKEDYHA